MALADDAIALGLPVFACRADKRPCTRHGFKDATLDHREIRSQFAHPDAAAIGVPTGSITGAIVVDVDVKAGARGLEWLEANRHRLPRTRTHRTGSGGFHLLFLPPRGDIVIGNTASRIAPGVDTRGNGGYVIAPPSPGYTVIDDSSLAEMPDWLVAACLPPRPEPQERPQRPDHKDSAGNTAYGLRALSDECDAVMNAAPGTQEVTLNAAAVKIGGLVKGGELMRGFAFSALTSAADGMANAGRPWTKREIEEKVRRGFDDATPRSAPERPQAEQTHRDERRGRDPDPEPDDPDQEAAPKAEAFDLFPPLLGSEVDLPARRWVGGPGAFPRPRVSAISGAPGVNKTTMALQIGIALATGQEYGGLVSAGEPSRVIVAAIEDDIEEIQRRLHAACAAFADSEHHRALVRQNLRLIDIADSVPLINVLPDGRCTETKGMTRLKATITAFQPDIVFLDPLLELHTAEENSNTAMRPVVRALRSLCTEYDIALAILHHETKSAEGTALQRLRGAAIGGGIRYHISLRQMTAAEAQEYGLDEDTIDLFVKVEGGKAQYARKAKPRWFEIQERELANGDRAHLLMPWSPAVTTIDAGMLSRAEDALRRGYAGEPCSESHSAGAYYRLAFDAAGIPRSAHVECLSTLKKYQTAELQKWRDHHARKVFTRLFVPGNRFDGWLK